jgi:hypothetical protein
LATVQFIDPVKAMDMLSEAAAVYFDRDRAPERVAEDTQDRAARRRWEKQSWVKDARGRILSSDCLVSLFEELEVWIREMHDDPGWETISRVITFLARERDAGRMNYRDPHATHIFAAAGILADSAKAIFGDRVDHPKFKIGLSAVRAILILRELTRTPGRWDEFWSRVRGRDQGHDRRAPD